MPDVDPQKLHTEITQSSAGMNAASPATLNQDTPAPKTLLVERRGRTATLTLHRPRSLNALNGLMLAELDKAVRRLGADPEVSVILLTGSGDRAFAAGADIRELTGLDKPLGQQFAAHGQRIFSAIEHCGKPVIACLNGLTLGGGLELALACTLRLASEAALLGLPEAKLGLIPGYGGLHRLIGLVGRSAALQLLLTAQSIGAAEALRLGLVDEVLPAAELMPRAHTLAETIGGLAPLAVGALLALARTEFPSRHAAFAQEAEAFGRLCGTADQREGVDAFLNKRPPQWTGK